MPTVRRRGAAAGRTARPARPIRLLLTGFGPFPGMPANPTEAIVRGIAARGLSAPMPVRLTARVLPTEWGALPTLEALVRAVRADVVLLTGVASGAGLARLERTARNRTGASLPDAAGRPPGATRLAPLPGRIVTPLGPHLPALNRSLARAGVAARVSDDAGAYLCNAGYFVALAAAARTPGPPDVLFLHIPPARPSRGRRLADLEAAVVAVARGLVARRAPSRPRQRGS